jgi:hypothetical protein
MYLVSKRNSARNGRRPPRGSRKVVTRGNGFVNRQSRSNNVVDAQRCIGTEVIQRTLPLFPAMVMKRLRYSTNIALASTAGAVTSYVFAANGLYDPDITSTGHQPMGFDEMMIYFNHYAVSYCKLTAVAKCVSSSKMTVCVRQDGSATPITVIDRIVEIGGGVIEYLELGSQALATKRLELGIDVAKVQGVSRSAFTADSSLRGTSAANPSELTYFHVQNWDAAAQTGTVNFDIIMEFDAIFTEPRDGTASLAERLEEMRLAHAMTNRHKDDCKVLCLSASAKAPHGHV